MQAGGINPKVGTCHNFSKQPKMQLTHIIHTPSRHASVKRKIFQNPRG